MNRILSTAISPIRRRTTKGIALFLFFLSLMFSATAGLAQVWKPGQQLLLKNNAKGAEAQLSTAIKKAKSKPELAETYKYLGVAQFMSGNKVGASASFQKAKSINPAITLKDTEVVDESVIPLFNSSAARSAQAAVRAPSGGKSASIARLQSNRTILKVLSNVPNSSVRIDGIAHGIAGDEITTDPGTVVVEVAAPGYRSTRNSIKVEKNKTSIVQVTLEKIQPKPKPQPQVQPAPQQKQPGIPLPSPDGSNLANSGAQNSKSANKAEKGSLFGDEPSAQEFAQQPTPQTTYQRPITQQPVTPPPPPVQPVMPTMPMTPVYQAAPMYQSPAPTFVQPPPVYAAPAYPAYPTYPAYQQPYPVSPYGGYMPPPASPYGYPQPAPPPSVYQPYAPPPVADPYGGYLGPPPEDPAAASAPAIQPSMPQTTKGGGMPPPARLPPPPSTFPTGGAKKAKASSEGCSTIIKILPFGAGQFCNGSTFKGLVFLGGEVVALYLYKSNSDAAATYQNKLDTIKAEREADRANVDPADLDAYDEETSQKEKQGNDVISKAKQNASYSMLSFGGLYALGVIDAFINEPPPKNKRLKKKKGRSRPRIMNSYNLDLEKAPLGTYALMLPQDIYGAEDVNFIVGYAPTTSPNQTRLSNSLVLGLSWEL